VFVCLSVCLSLSVCVCVCVCVCGWVGACPVVTDGVLRAQLSAGLAPIPDV
jgi:hypothetical protein